ncbi:MAG: radical SAM protein [Lachnospiraceae bacterium]|nr:radical SAM protein [Lachnospiraceae bacterium]
MKNTIQTIYENQSWPELSDCTLCPRECHVNRNAGETGYCGQTGKLTAARAALHFWEEPCLSGTNGSGAVFFSGCNLGCVYCQNHEIAQGQSGREITVNRLSDIFLELQEKGAHNINLVTPAHFVPQIITALQTAKKQGLSIPVIYNTSAYEKTETLRMLEGLIDIYLPDLKYRDAALSGKYSHADDYFERAAAAIAEMVRQVGAPVFADGEDSLMRRGVIVRHLLLPGCVRDSRQLLRYLHETYKNDIYVSIMNQYTPLSQVSDIPPLNRRVSAEEYRRIVDYAIRIGIENGFIQEGETATESFIPSFDYEGI